MLYETKKKDNNIVHDIRTYIYINTCIRIHVWDIQKIYSFKACLIKRVSCTNQ